MIGTRLRWRRHHVTAEALLDGNGQTGERRRWVLRASRGAPSGFTFVDLSVASDRRTDARLFAETNAGDILHCYEFADLVDHGSVRRLVHLPADARRFLIELESGVTVERMRVTEVGSIPLLAVLSQRWLRRQLRRPGRLGQKVATVVRVVVTRGPSAARSSLLVAQMSAQQNAVETDLSDALSRMDTKRRSAREHDRNLDEVKRHHDEGARTDLQGWLAAGDRLDLTCRTRPRTSIVLVTYNRAELSLACLRSIRAHAGDDVEVVVVDNASTDDTNVLLDRLDGVVIVRNSENRGYLIACNQAVEVVSGDEVLLLNNDCTLEPGALEAARQALEADSTLGVVGGMIVALDGRLQEAGSIVWADGSCQGYGRGDDPDQPEYRFRRRVDFVSGAFLLTPRSVWNALGGFDEAFAPAYYEDVDYCFRAADRGWGVVYEPNARVIHYEYGSSDARNASARVAMTARRHTLVARHPQRLSQQPATASDQLEFRTAAPRGRRLLFVDDRIPDPSAGSGAPRTAALLRAFVELGLQVTFFPTLPFSGSWDNVYLFVPREVEVVLGPGRGRLRRFLEERRGHYDDVIVSRGHNLELVLRLARGRRRLLDGARLVFDAEAVAAQRDLTRAAMLGDTAAHDRALAALDRELEVLRGVDEVIAVSAEERDVMTARGVVVRGVVGHSIELAPTPLPRSDRSDLLFVGALVQDGSPNVDAVKWFAEEVLPRLWQLLVDEPEPRLLVAGRLAGSSLSGARYPGVEFLGGVEDLDPLFERARVFVAPTRFAAGVPLKVYEAASRGVPVVTTDLLARQLGWEAGIDLLAAPVNDADAFAQACALLYRDDSSWNAIREAALRRVEQECAPDRFRQSVARALHLDVGGHGVG